MTDKLRAPYREAKGGLTVPGQMLDEIVAANPARRTLLKNSVGMSLLSVFGITSLAACGGSGSETPSGDGGGTTPTGPDYSVTFKPLPGKTAADTVTVPEGYVAEVLYSAGDKCVAGSAGYAGVPQSYPATETQAGGQHDGMHFYPLDGVDPNKGGLLVLNHENVDSATLDLSVEATRTNLSNVGVSVIEIARADDGTWSVKQGSRYNKRYTGNTVYNVGGPAASVVGRTVVGTLNNCASGNTPWGTYLTCEETTNNYWDNTRDAKGYGWVVEIDPQDPSSTAVKRTAMGRFAHENTAYMVDENNRVAFYMGDDSTPGCIYKFVPSRAYSSTSRSANTNLLDNGTLYVARFNADGTGEWRALVVGQNGLTTGAIDPGNASQSTTAPTPVTVNFTSQADVVINCASAARVAGGTVMDRPEWITVAPNKQSIFVTLTNNGSRAVADAANPRTQNLHGHILKFRENGDSPLALGFTWEIFLLAGNPSVAEANLKGNINGDYFSSPDGIRIDPQGRLWVQTDHNLTGNAGTLNGAATNMTGAFGNNSMYHIDQTTKLSKRFLVGPEGCEITGIAYTPDLKSFFINIQHPTKNWPVDGQQPRSSTIVVRRTDAQPVGN
ncbi:MAG: PhoX family phosphatase [Sphingobium sp.]